MTDTPTGKSIGRKSIRPTLKPRALMTDAPDIAGAWTAQIITLFPQAFPGVLGESLMGRALKDGLWQLQTFDLRDYGIGAQMLTFLGVRHMRLLTNNPKKIVGLAGHGLDLLSQEPLRIDPNSSNERYLWRVADRFGRLSSMKPLVVQMFTLLFLAQAAIGDRDQRPGHRCRVQKAPPCACQHSPPRF